VGQKLSLLPSKKPAGRAGFFEWTNRRMERRFRSRAAEAFAKLVRFLPVKWQLKSQPATEHRHPNAPCRMHLRKDGSI